MRWIFRLIGGVLLLVVLAVGVVSLIPAEKIAGIATREISERTGREVAFTGRIRPVFYPILGVRTDGLRVGNADWASDVPMLSADSLLVGVEFWPLLSGEVRIKEFRLVTPQITLEKAADGRVNWALDAGLNVDATPSNDDAAAKSGTLPDFSLKDGQISNGALVYLDHQASKTTRIDDLDLAVAIPSSAGALKLSGALRYNGQNLSFEAGISELAGLIAGRVIDLHADLGGDFGDLSFNGRAGLAPLVADGVIETKISDFALMGKLAGRDDLAAGLASQANLSAKLTYAENGTIYLRDAQALIDENQFAGEMDLTLKNIPHLTARLVAGDLNLANLAGDLGGDNATPSETPDGWSKKVMYFSGLQALDADISFSAPSIDLGRAKLGETRLRLRLDRGRLVVGLTSVEAYEGKISGEFVVNARNGLSMGGDLAIADIQLQPLLKDTVDYDRLIAASGFSVKFLTSGNNMDAMMRRMSGSGRFDIGQGEIIGLDLLGMLRNLDASYRGEGNKTIFSEITGSFQIADGVLENSDLKFASGVLDASGQGQVDIGSQTVTYRILPVAFSGQNVAEAGGLSVPVLVSGPWSNLSYRPDLQGLFDAELDIQRKALEEKLKTDLENAQKEAEAKVQEEIDNAVQKAIDDALKRALGQD